MAGPKELYIADSIYSLKIIASKNFDEIRRTKKFDLLCSSAKKLYKEIYLDRLDEEKIYIYLMRFIFIYNQMLKVSGDENFVRLRFGDEVNMAQMQIKIYEQGLMKRYEDKKKREASTDSDSDSDSLKPFQITVFDTSDMFISCHELVAAIKDKQKVLLLDMRREQEFNDSHIRDIDCLNVPEDMIYPGATANKLGKAFIHGQDFLTWSNRGKYAVVLMDWNTSRLDYTSSKLWSLRCILLQWDFQTTYVEPPVMLDGGYQEFLENYPSMSTNATVILFKANTDLDELLELDEVVYPVTLQPEATELISSSSTTKDLCPEVDQSPSCEEIKMEEREVLKRRREIESDIIETEKEWQDTHKLSMEEELASYEKKLQTIQDRIDRLKEDRKQLRSIGVNLAKMCETNTVPTEEEGYEKIVNEIDVLEEESMKNNQVLDAMAAERVKLLNEARKVKPSGDSTKDSSSTSSFLSLTSQSTDDMSEGTAEFLREATAPYVPKQATEKPPVDRLTKPDKHRSWSSLLSGTLGPIKTGLAGLVNIHNTCYMNTIIQCLRHMPELLYFFLSGRYVKCATRTPDVLLSETATLFRMLWYNINNFVEPKSFYNALCKANPIYANGQHEDAMEFFTFYLTQLCEDTAEVITGNNKILSPVQKSWIDNLNGKTSVFTSMFYYQIKVVRECPYCNKKNFSFEVENTIMVAVPNQASFSLQQAVNDYLEDVSYYKKFKCCKCSNSVENPMKKYKLVSSAPKILVIDLKRYKRNPINSAEPYIKNDAEVFFPLTDFNFGNYKYELYAMALHSGSMQAGHYTAVCKNPLLDQWFEFNDADVFKVSQPDGRNQRVKARAFFYVQKVW